MQTIALLEKIGVSCDGIHDYRKTHKLIFVDENYGLRFLIVGGPDVPAYVEYGAADIGVTGKDIIMEENRDIHEALDLGFGKCRICLAGSDEAAQLLKEKKKIRVATRYPKITGDYFKNIKKQDADIITLTGSMELAPLIGISDVIVDIVQTGTTLKENGLKVLEGLYPVSARVVVNRDSLSRDNYRIMRLLNNMESALLS